MVWLTERIASIGWTHEGPIQTTKTQARVTASAAVGKSRQKHFRKKTGRTTLFCLISALMADPISALVGANPHVASECDERFAWAAGKHLTARPGGVALIAKPWNSDPTVGVISRGGGAVFSGPIGACVARFNWVLNKASKFALTASREIARTAHEAARGDCIFTDSICGSANPPEPNSSACSAFCAWFAGIPSRCCPTPG